MKSVTLGEAGMRLRYLEFEGDGSPLLMIHGLGCASSFEYPHVAQDVALRHRHTLLIDLPGFGFSDRPESFGYTVSDHARAVVEFIGQRQFSIVSLYGHSMGGSVAIEVADMLGARIDNLIISEANLDSGGGIFSRSIAAMGEEEYVQRGHEAITRDALEEGNDAWATTMRSASPRAVFRGAQSLVQGGTPDWRRQLIRHPARKAFIFGERGLPDPDYDVLSDAGISVLTVRDAGHSMSTENPAGLAASISLALN